MQVKQKITAIPVVNRFLGDDLNTPELQKLEEEEKEIPDWEEVFEDDDQKSSEEEVDQQDEDEEEEDLKPIVDNDESSLSEQSIKEEFDVKEETDLVTRDKTDYEVVFPEGFRPPTDQQGMIDQVIDLRKIRVSQEQRKGRQNKPQVNKHGKRIAKEQDFDSEDEDRRSNRKQKKEPRKTTGHVPKKNYYDEVNTKNKNRQEKKIHPLRKKKKAPKHQGPVKGITLPKKR